MRNNESWEESTVKQIKSRESNPMVRTVERSTVGRSKSRESNPVVHTVSYDEIMMINILPS